MNTKGISYAVISAISTGVGGQVTIVVERPFGSTSIHIVEQESLESPGVEELLGKILVVFRSQTFS